MMGDLNLKAASGGQIALTPTNTASNYTLTLPAATGTVALTASPTFTGTTTTGAQSVGGNITFSAADAGIIFNKTGALTNSTLNDYEEGTWTPELRFGGSSTGITYSSGGQIGRYIKIGRNVLITVWLQLTNKGSATGDATIANLPFTALNSTNVYQGFAVPHWASLNTVTYVGCYINPNAVVINMSGGTPPSSISAGLTNTNFNNDTYFLINMSYVANS